MAGEFGVAQARNTPKRILMPTKDRGEEPSPLRAERLRRGLTIGQVAHRTALSKDAISLAERGLRSAPGALLVFLGIGDLKDRQHHWRQQQRRASATLTITTELPEGLTRDEARQICLRAIRDLAESART